MMVAKVLATCFGIGYVQKGAGTLAALFCCLLWWWAPVTSSMYLRLAATVLLFALGTWSAGVVEKEWGHDSNRVVIDEVLGMCVALLWVPVTPVSLLLAFVLFRFFDILKPLYIRRAERLPGGWGVMADDLLAGIYANLVMQVFLLLNIL